MPQSFPLSALALVAFLSAALPSSAQIPLPFQYQKRQDRFEGVKDARHAAGEHLELLSATIPVAAQLPREPETMYLGFFLEREGNVAITVRQPEMNYWMEPIDERGRKRVPAKPGFNYFTWDGRIVKYLARQTEELSLCALVARTDTRATSVIPAILYDASSKPQSDIPVEEYEFTFFPNAEVSLTYEIKAPGGETVDKDDLLDMPEEKPIKIRWRPGRHQRGQYQLSLSAQFPVRDRPPVKQTMSLSFLHVGVIKVGE